jgi:hypothetical protein
MATLETLAWIAAIVAIPVAVIGWFFGGKKKINKSVASASGAISGDVRVDGSAGFVTGHHSPMNVHLTVGGNTDVYEKRNTIFNATRKLIDESSTHKLFSDETINAFVTGVRDAPLLFDDDGIVEYLNEIRKHATSLQAITMTMVEGPLFEHERADPSRVAGEHRRWLIGQSDDVLAQRFRPFLQTQAIQTIERPYILIHGISFQRGHGEQRAPCITYSVSNIGKLAAVVENVSIRCGMMLNDRFPPLIIMGDHLLLQVPILSPDQERDGIECTLPRELLQYEPPIRWPKDRMIFQVVVTYRGPATNGHETAQCWRFTWSFKKGFVEVAHPQYTYTR